MVTWRPRTSWQPPRFMPEQFSTPLLSSQEQISKLATTRRGRWRRASSTASAMWSEWPWVMSIASNRSSFLCPGGQAGLPSSPGVDQDDLAAREIAADGGMSQEGEAGALMRALIHLSASSGHPALAGRGRTPHQRSLVPSGLIEDGKVVAPCSSLRQRAGSDPGPLRGRARRTPAPPGPPRHCWSAGSSTGCARRAGRSISRRSGPASRPALPRTGSSRRWDGRPPGRSPTPARRAASR